MLIASVFMHPLMTSVWYCLGVFSGCGRTWGLAPTCSNYEFWIMWERSCSVKGFSLEGAPGSFDMVEEKLAEARFDYPFCCYGRYAIKS